MITTAKWNDVAYKMAKSFVVGEMSASDFSDKYTDLYYDKSMDGIKVEVEETIKDPNILMSIFCVSDLHLGEDCTDDELRQMVTIFLDADSVDEAYKELENNNLIK